MLDQLRIAVLGLGEAGSVFASGLVAAGAHVTGWDPGSPSDPALRRLLAGSSGDAVSGADVVLSINTAGVSESVAAEVADDLLPRAVFADLNTAAPSVKVKTASVVEVAGALFADVALLAPVERRGLRTPAMVSGSGADSYASMLADLCPSVEVVEGGSGAAASRKLLRSVFMKGMAAVVLEALEAARTAECEPWLRAQMVSEFESADEGLLTRLVEGSHHHAARRVHEMQAARDLLDELQTPSRVTSATLAWLERIASQGAPPTTAHVDTGADGV